MMEVIFFPFSAWMAYRSGSVEVALAKAKSAVFFKRPTKVFEDAMKAEGGGRIATLPNAVAIEGGLPIFKDGVIVGPSGSQV